MTEYATGLYPEMFQLFENLLNFTGRQFARNDRSWNNMMNNLENGEADLITTSYTLVGSRITRVDWLSPISTATLGFAIKGTLLLQCSAKVQTRRPTYVCSNQIFKREQVEKYCPQSLDSFLYELPEF